VNASAEPDYDDYDYDYDRAPGDPADPLAERPGDKGGREGGDGGRDEADSGRDLRELARYGLLLAIAVLGYFVVPPGVGRAVLVLSTIVWIPGRCLVQRLGLHDAAGIWSVPLSVLLSFTALIILALLEYAAFRHVDFGPLPLWASLVTLAAAACRRWHGAGFARRRTSTSAAFTPRGILKSPLGTGAALFAGVAASAGILAGVYNALPGQPQAGYLQFAYTGPYAALPGVITASAGQQLAIPFSVTAVGEDASGLTVVRQIAGAAIGPAVPVANGQAVVDVPVAGGCSRYTFALERGGGALRTLDLYVSTGGSAACQS
jgi:hypothetical protein